MDISLKPNRHAQALPPARPQALAPTHTLALTQQQAPHALRLKAWDSLRLRVQRGTLWLTQEGLPDDHFLPSGQEILLLGPARYRLGAMDGAGVELALLR